jgi:hypothetical protein
LYTPFQGASCLRKQNFFCQKEVELVGCSTFSFRAPKALSQFSGSYTKNGMLNGLNSYKHGSQNFFVFKSINGKWVFSSDFASKNGTLFAEQTSPCPAKEISTWMYKTDLDNIQPLKLAETSEFSRNLVERNGNPFFSTYCQYLKVSNSELYASESFDGVYKTNGDFQGGMPVWAFKNGRIARDLNTLVWKLSYNDDHFFSSDEVFCPGDALWTHSSGQVTANLVSEEDIPVNCLTVTTRDEDYRYGS